jgi:hypothetical protein
VERNRSAVPPHREPLSPGPEAALTKKPFVAPKLTEYEPVQRITLVSNAGFPGSGGTGGTFFGS